MPEAITLDTSCWVEVLRGSALGDESLARAHAASSIVVPATCIYEIRRWMISTGTDEGRALTVLGYLGQQDVRALTASLAERAAVITMTTGLAFADASILATARAADAPLITLDADFAGLPGVTAVLT